MCVASNTKESPNTLAATEEVLPVLLLLSESLDAPLRAIESVAWNTVTHQAFAYIMSYNTSELPVPFITPHTIDEMEPFPNVAVLLPILI